MYSWPPLGGGGSTLRSHPEEYVDGEDLEIKWHLQSWSSNVVADNVTRVTWLNCKDTRLTCCSCTIGVGCPVILAASCVLSPSMALAASMATGCCLQSSAQTGRLGWCLGAVFQSLTELMSNSVLTFPFLCGQVWPWRAWWTCLYKVLDLWIIQLRQNVQTAPCNLFWF